MRRDRAHLFPLISLLLLFSTLSYGQAWSGILAPNRAIDWSHAGLPATLPDGETTPNPWTPPTRTQCGATVSPLGSGQNDESQIAAALSKCAAGHYVLLGPGTFTISSNLFISPGYGSNDVTLRGSGPMSTILGMSGGSSIYIGAASSGGSGTVAGGSLAPGSTSITLSSVTGTGSLAVGNLASFSQCDTGYSGSGCTGSAKDNGGIYICVSNSSCVTDSPNANVNTSSQQQTVLITSVTNNGNGTYTVGFSPGLYMPNWSQSSNIGLTWESNSYLATGVGLEDFTILFQHQQSEQVQVSYAYASWVKGVRFIGAVNFPFAMGTATKNNLLVNSYFFGENPTAFDSGGWTINISEGGTDNLFLNTISHGGLFAEGGGYSEGNVIAYNYNRDITSVGYQPTELQHNHSPALQLFEANQMDRMIDDNTWSSHHLETFFRNYLPCWDTPFDVPGVPGGGIQIGSYARFENAIGNVIGDTSTVGMSKCNTYISTSVGDNYMFSFAGSGDPINQPSAMLWGNCDAVNGGCRFVSSEVPTSLAAWANSVPFQNAVPSTHNLPASFFMNGVSAHSNGGTGLSWWKVCTSWATFPTSCNASQTQPFPTAGPDVSSGPYVNGYAYDIPASIAYKYLPVDTTFQNSYTISSSSWSGGIETLTISSTTPLPNTDHLMGGFQITGVAACNSAAGSEFLMTGSAVPSGGSGGTISYAVASNPGNCAGGTVKWPDIRQFDERVYQTDAGGDPAVNPPTGLSAVVN